MSLDYFRSIGEYNRWANRRVLEQTAKCSIDDYLAQSSGLSFGSLHATLVHVFMAEIVWLARWQGSATRGTEGRVDRRPCRRRAHHDVP
jgi:uncharacterized damage-inducible protein DinB